MVVAVVCQFLRQIALPLPLPLPLGFPNSLLFFWYLLPLLLVCVCICEHVYACECVFMYVYTPFVFFFCLDTDPALSCARSRSSPSQIGNRQSGDTHFLHKKNEIYYHTQTWKIPIQLFCLFFSCSFHLNNLTNCSCHWAMQLHYYFMDYWERDESRRDLIPPSFQQFSVKREGMKATKQREQGKSFFISNGSQQTD